MKIILQPQRVDDYKFVLFSSRQKTKLRSAFLQSILLVLVICGDQIFAQDLEFKVAKDVANNTVEGVSSLDVGDLNGDGLGDVVVIEGGKHAGGRKTFAWFEAPDSIEKPWTRHDFNNSSQLRSFLGSAKLADMDNDGDLDLIVSSDNHSGGSKQADLYVYINPGIATVTGTWQFHRITSSTLALHHINDMEVADMDMDGKLDIIIRSLSPNQIHIFFQDDISSYTQKIINTGIQRSEGLSVGFLDEDNLPDITFTGHWLKSPDNPRSQDYTKLNIDSEYKNSNQNTKEAIGDIDGDGKNDVIIAPAEAFRNGGNTVLAWYKNPGNTANNNWPKNIIVNSINNIHTVKLGDIDNDGDLDVIAGIPWSNSVIDISVRVYYNNGSGLFSNAQVVTSGKGLYSGVVYDIDDDGDMDIIGQNTYSRSSKPYVYKNLLNETLSVDTEIMANNSAVLYPNPTSGNVTIEIPAIAEEWNYQIITTTGKVLQLGKINKSYNSMDFGEQNSGVYIMKLTSGKREKVIKILKQ